MTHIDDLDDNHRPDDQDPEQDDPYADSPDAESGDAACDCHGAWHAVRQHCVDWPCPECPSICPPEPGVEID